VCEVQLRRRKGKRECVSLVVAHDVRAAIFQNLQIVAASGERRHKDVFDIVHAAGAPRDEIAIRNVE